MKYLTSRKFIDRDWRFKRGNLWLEIGFSVEEDSLFKINIIERYGGATGTLIALSLCFFYLTLEWN